MDERKNYFSKRFQKYAEFLEVMFYEQNINE
jgi:hypothetical protein